THGRGHRADHRRPPRAGARERPRCRGHRGRGGRMTDRTLRGRAAIVGVADAASPTGELDRHGRAIEAVMIREARDDAGLTLADVDGLAYAGQTSGLAEYLGVHPRYLDGTQVGGS